MDSVSLRATRRDLDSPRQECRPQPSAKMINNQIRYWKAIEEPFVLSLNILASESRFSLNATRAALLSNHYVIFNFVAGQQSTNINTHNLRHHL